MSTRPTWDQMKRERDGHTSAGRVKQGEGTWWPKQTAVGYDASGKPVAECTAWGSQGGEVAYGNVDAVVRWERTEAGREIFGTGDER